MDAKNQPDRLLRIADVLKIVAISKSQWNKLIRTGAAPRPLKLGERTAAWREQDIIDWCAQLSADRLPKAA